MENKLVCGDYVPDGVGGILRQEQEGEILSRALFCLQCRRGSFAYLPELGSRLWQLRRHKGEDIAPLAAAYGAEAVLPLGLTVTNVQAAWLDGDLLQLDFALSGQDAEGTVEVTL